jgi:hypothetical protein
MRKAIAAAALTAAALALCQSITQAAPATARQQAAINEARLCESMELGKAYYKRPDGKPGDFALDAFSACGDKWINVATAFSTTYIEITDMLHDTEIPRLTQQAALAKERAERLHIEPPPITPGWASIPGMQK